MKNEIIKLAEEQVKEELRKPLGYISKWLIQLRRECSKAQGYTPGEKQVVHMNLSKIQTELEVAKLMLKEDCFPLISSLLQKEREAGKREGIELAILEVKELEIRSDDGGDYITSDTELMRTEAVEALLELKSNSLQEKLEIDDFKFDKKGNSIP